MRLAGISGAGLFARCVIAATLLLLASFVFAAGESVDQLIEHADQIKLVNHDQFQILLKQLDAQRDQLNVLQRDWLDYLHAWQLGYQGDYPEALTAFNTLQGRTHDPTVRARARISLIYDQVNAAHYEDAYATLSDLLDSLPQIADHNAHFLVLVTAAYLYSDAGQYDLAMRYIDLASGYEQSESSTCIVGDLRIEALYKAGKLRAEDGLIRTALDACQRIGNSNDTNSINYYLARTLLDHQRIADALKLLNAHDAEVFASHSSALNAEYRATLARGYLLAGDFAQARDSAASAINAANKQVYSKAVTVAYKVLFEVAKHQGDDREALAYQEKSAAADKGYLNGVSARALAYQMVHQQVLEKKRQIDTLSEKNKLLQLQQQVDTQSIESRRQYILLLLAGLIMVVGWAYRTKRSQIKFQHLARRDALTGISNRQHFFDAAQEVLRNCAKNVRDASVLTMDLDHFKSVNDRHGHAAGDDVLKRAAAICQTHLRSVDLFGRLGGEEFAMLLPDCNGTVAARRANEMREAIAELPGNASAEVVITASFGVATTQVCGYNLTSLLAHADNALYAAKHAGRNRVSVHRAGVEAKNASI